MRKTIRAIVVATGLSLATSAAHAQTLFSGSGCSGNTFLFCGSWTGTYIDATHFSVFITNTSQNAPAINTFSAFTQIVLGNVTIADPASMGAVTGWQYDPSVSGFNGLGLLENQFGAILTNAPNNALTDGNSQNFAFTMGSSIGSFTDAQTAFAGVQVGIADMGGPAPGCVSRGVLSGNASGQNTSSITAPCAPSVVPEPSTYVLMATGLIGVFGLARRRRAS